MALAGGIIFLHCIFPHVHDSSLHEVLHNKHSSLLCALKDLVQKDFGEGHLSNFIKSHTPDLKSPCASMTDASPDTVWIISVSTFRLKGDPYTSIATYLVFTPELRHGPPLPTRGPPSSMTIAGLT